MKKREWRKESEEKWVKKREWRKESEEKKMRKGSEKRKW